MLRVRRLGHVALLGLLLTACAPSTTPVAGPTTPATEVSSVGETSPSTDVTVTPSENSDPPSFRLFAAVGDSYASGLGAGDHYDCGRSPHGWVSQVAETLGAESVVLACPGAVLEDALEQSTQIDENVTDVGVSILGNDLEFFRVVARCASGDCSNAVRESLALLPGLRQQLDLLLMRVAENERQVVLAGYPSIFGENCTSPISRDDAALLNSAIDTVNEFLEDATTRAYAAGFDVHFGPPADFRGHDVCAAESWVVGFSSELMLHPTREGYRAIAAAAVQAAE